MKSEVKKKAKNYFKKCFFNLLNNVDFGKTLGNVKKLRDQTYNNRSKKKLFPI